MTPNDKVVSNISLSLLAGDNPETYNLSPAPVSFDFIFGIETSGLTPFELILNEMRTGESTSIELAGNDLESFFGNLFQSFCKVISLHHIPDILFLQVTLEKCAEASPREIVQAMAKSVGHGGCGGGCGCGCH